MRDRPDNASGSKEPSDTYSPPFKARSRKAIGQLVLSIDIENIDEMRRKAGIVDVEFECEILALDVGDFVRVTLLSKVKPFGAETLLVEIESIRGNTFLGRLAEQPRAAGLAHLSAGATILITRAHIHSIAKRHSIHE